QIELDRAQRNLFKGEKQKLDLDAADAMKVRTMVLPVELDDKGKPKKLTEKEKRELKGPDATLPGYTADFDSRNADQMVDIYLAKQPPKSKAKDQDQDADKTANPRPKIAMIVILADGTK